MAQSLVGLLQEHEPRNAVDVVTTSGLWPLARRMPGIRHCETLATGHGQLGLRERWRLGRALRQRQYDAAIVLPNSWKSALLPFFARIPRRAGYRGELRYGLLTDVRLHAERMPRMVDRYLALGRPPGTPGFAPEPRLIAERLPAERLRALGLTDSRPVLALCPGAEYGPAKRWPTAHFATVARSALAQGWQVWLLGGPGDRPVAADIQHAAGGPCVDLTGQTGLGEVVDVLALAHAVVGNDSGLMHIAAALDRPQVALFGSSSAEHTPPLSRHAVALSLQLPCSPCYARQCPLGHTHCLVQLSPARVLQSLAQIAPGWAA